MKTTHFEGNRTHWRPRWHATLFILWQGERAWKTELDTCHIGVATLRIAYLLRIPSSNFFFHSKMLVHSTNSCAMTADALLMIDTGFSRPINVWSNPLSKTCVVHLGCVCMGRQSTVSVLYTHFFAFYPSVGSDHDMSSQYCCRKLNPKLCRSFGGIVHDVSISVANGVIFWKTCRLLCRMGVVSIHQSLCNQC